jgi:STE24 endopeptidase
VQLVVLILVAVVLLDDRMPMAVGDGETIPGWFALAAVTVPPILALLIQRWLVSRTERAMDRRSPTGARLFDRAEGVMRAMPWLALLATGTATLGLDWLYAVRSTVGNWPAVDELLAMLPAFTAMAASWWIHEPLERRLRDAALIRNLDEGAPIASWKSPARFVIGRVRTNILLLLAPLIVVVALSELVEPPIEARWGGFWESGGRELVTLSIAGIVYLISPLIARVVLHLEPLPPGDLRTDLQSVCDECGVRVRDILLWRTEYGMVNGAVMGLVAPLRYVMLTDGLIELLPRAELRAVMAHEIGHVRRHHLPWMLGILVALLILASFAVEWPARVIDESIRSAAWSIDEKITAIIWLDRSAAVIAACVALVLFGWISRRIERQADSFAVQFLSSSVNSPAITPESVVAMSGALGAVARYAGVPRNRMSWRHGSILWRQTYLEGLVGMSATALPIDRLVGRLKVAALLLLAAFVALFVLEASSRPPNGNGAARSEQSAGYDATLSSRTP